jgi:tetratricopeptide (TPR) repeat protein
MSIQNSDESEFPRQLRKVDEFGEDANLDLEAEWLNLDTGDAEDDIALVSDLFRQISQETFPNENAAEASESNYTQEISSPQTTELPTEKLSQVERSKSQTPYLIGIGLAIALGITSIVTLLWGRLNPQEHPVTTVTSIAVNSNSAKTQNLQQLDTPKLSVLSSQKFSQGDINGGTAALEVLLDRNALPEAKQALSAISVGQMDTPEISFLRGRLIWQSLDENTKPELIQQVSTFWQKAVKKEPNSALYKNALGFAYYTENKFNQAIDVWFEAIALGEAAKSKHMAESAQKQVLNNYAGIALALWRIAQTQPPARKQELEQEAIKLGRKVITEAPTDFQAEKLSQDWMWSKTAIQDWRSFLKEKSLQH